ncbi:MAG TPA: glycosyltransferase N-terminal domain-containing protein [Flavobacteriales bacterium]|nr:glycosyltransferase N-terminal domain-containing protein [Flavobacteriales bacterium]
MPLLYDIGVGLYHTGIKLAAPFNPKAKAWLNGRDAALWGTLEMKQKKLRGCLWMHCASVGEFEQGRPVLEAIKAQRPELPVLVTFHSPSGYEACVNYELATHVEYLPADGAANARRFIDLIQPRAVIWVKYEFWFHWLTTLKTRSIPVFLVSAIFRKDQPFFKWYGGTHRKMLKCFSQLFAQDEASRDLLVSTGVTNVTVSGDTRFDRVMSIVDRAAEGHPTDPEFRIKMDMFRVVQDGPTLIGGSTWPKDIDLIHQALGESRRGISLILAPHETPSHEEVMHVVRSFKRPVGTWHGIVPSRYTPSADMILMMDRNGFLSRLYAYADIAYVGGGFGDGIHSLLEAAAWGKPVIFGPNHHKFAEAKGLIDAGGGFEVHDAAQLRVVLDRLLSDPSALAAASEAARSYVKDRVGATQRIVQAIAPQIS